VCILAFYDEADGRHLIKRILGAAARVATAAYQGQKYFRAGKFRRLRTRRA
jgi:hypothetical protein